MSDEPVNLALAPVAGRQAEVPLERAAKGCLRLVPCLIGNGLNGRVAQLEILSGKLQAPASEILHRRLIEEMLEAFAQDGTRHPDLSRQALHAPIIEGFG